MFAGIGMYFFATFLVIDKGFTNFFIAIGTGLFASALTALLIDRSREKEQEKLALCMKRQILYDILSNLRFWVNHEDKIWKFKIKLEAEYMREQIKECQRAIDFCIPYLNEQEYLALSIIEAQLKEMQKYRTKYKEDERYVKYADAYEWLLYDTSLGTDLSQIYEYEQVIVKKYGLDERIANDISISAFFFNVSMKLIKDNLIKFDYIKINEI